MLAEAQAAPCDGADGTGRAPLHRPAARLSEIAEAVDAEDRRQRRCHLAHLARRRTNRLGTISALHRDGDPRPHLRLSGKWLREAGFGVGRHFEVEVGEGWLSIELV